MTDEIEAFARRHNLDAAELAEHAARGWPATAEYLKAHGVDPTRLGKEDAFLWMMEPPRTGPEPAGEAMPTVPERERIAAILNAPEAKGREGFAQHLALETPLSAEEAIGLLRTVPVPQAQAAPATAPAPRGYDGPTMEALVPCMPSQAAHPSARKAAGDVWTNVLVRLNGKAA